MPTLLLVEDNEFNLKLARFILAAAGYEVLEAASAEDGLRLARNHLPDAVLMDIQLPDMDGIAVARLLREDPATRRLPLIALTASVMKGDRDRIMVGGFDSFLGKPFRKEALLNVVASVLGDEAVPNRDG